MKKFLKVFAVALVCFVMVMSAGTYIFLDSLLDKGQAFSDNGNLISEDKLPERKERVNVLVVGVDAKNSVKSEHTRTDTMMLATFDPNTKKVGVISIPRDTRVVIRGRRGKEKINHAHAYGGMSLSMKAVKDLLGVPVHYYVKVNYAAVGKIVDDVGGVEMYVPRNMNYYDPKADPPLRINLKKGNQILDSNKAMQFIRYRKGYQNQDLGRIDAQHEFIKALANKLLSPKIIIKLPKIIETFNTYVDTNMPVTQMIKYASYGKDIDLESVNMVTIPGKPEMINGLWYYIPNTKQMDEMVKQVIEGTYMVSSKTKSKVSIEVLNGSNKNGLATKVANELKQKGYNIINIGNAKGMKYDQSHIYDRRSNDEETKKISQILDIKKVEKKTSTDTKADITIILGNDIKR